MTRLTILIDWGRIQHQEAWRLLASFTNRSSRWYDLDSVMLRLACTCRQAHLQWAIIAGRP